MRQRVKRTSPRWGPILAVLLVLNCLAALVFSPLTVIRKVRVEGVPASDQVRYEAIADKLKGIPCALVNNERVESQAMEDPQVRSASFSRNLFGSAVLKIGYRQPVAVLQDAPDVGISIEGVPFRTGHVPAGLPVIQIDGEKPIGMRTLAEDWPLISIADLAVRARAAFPEKALKIELGGGGAVCLNMDAGQVVLGSCDELESKLTALKNLLNQKPGLLQQVQSLNLSVPSAPVAVPLTLGAKK